ncbi:MAG: outer membrane protein transport protein [Rikenellaceae bacterium]
MKKTILCALAVAFSLNAYAEGYQVNTLSAKQLGMGHTSVSQKLNSESVWFNPAAAVFQDQKFSVSAGVTGIMATATCTPKDNDDPTATYGNPTTYTSDNDWSTPLYLYANYKVNENLSVGLSLNTPFGSSMNWGDDWAGAHLVQNISLQSYTAQPTISYKMLDGKLSIGAGLMMSWGTFELSRSMFEVTPGSSALVSATLGGDAGVKFGINAGVMYNINDKWTLGASYRSRINMAVDAGEAQLNYASDAIKDAYDPYIPDIDTGTFTAELPLPSTLSLGTTFCPTDRWNLSAEFQWVQWGAYDVLDVKFNEPSLNGYSITATKNYSNTMITRFGAQYVTADWLTTRLGFYVDESPVASDYMNPETPSMTKVGYTCGFSIMPCKKNRDFSIDFAYAYISSADPERAGSYPIIDSTGAVSDVFSANYTTKAHTVSFGVSVGF